MTHLDAKIFETKTGKPLEIRSLNSGDAEALQNFLSKIADETTHTLRCRERETSLNTLQEAIERTLQSPCELFVGVFDEKSLIATLNFRVHMHDHPWVQHVGEFGMAVLKDHWGQGIGRELLGAMEQFAARIGVTRIEAKVRCNNERGTALYRRSGFKIEGIRENGAFINSKFENEYFIAKLLHSEQEHAQPFSFREVTYSDGSFALTLRPVAENDAEVIHDAVIRSLDILHPFMDWSHRALSVENQRQRIRKSMGDSSKGISYDFSVFDLETGEFLMSASLHPPRVPNKKCFGIGYWVVADHCNKGLATLITKILIVIAFESFNCDRVEIFCNKANNRSLRVIEKCGFKHEGEAKNYFPKPISSMLENGYHSERTGLQYAFVKEDIEDLTWFEEVKSKIYQSA